MFCCAHPEVVPRVVDAGEAFEEFMRDRSAHICRVSSRTRSWKLRHCHRPCSQDTFHVAAGQPPISPGGWTLGTPGRRVFA